MKKCRITVAKVTEHTDLMARYENPMLHACDLREGQVFIANGWMKNPRSAMISCNDGFRPVSFYIEALDEDAD